MVKANSNEKQSTWYALDILLRVGSLALLWYILNGDDLDSWLIGVPVVIVATFISAIVMPGIKWGIRPYAILRFSVYFLSKSLLSSIDVASRVMRPKMPLKPGIMHYPLRIKHTNARVIIANITSLLPGTLSVSIENNELIVHVLNVDDPIMDELRRLETHVAGIHGIQLKG